MKQSIKIRRRRARAAASNGSVKSNGTGLPPVPPAPPVKTVPPPQETAETVDLERRRKQLSATVAELQWDLGGLAYEMAVRNRMRTDVIVKRAAVLQEADAELREIERLLRLERTGVAALCMTCGAPHSSGAVFCWQCGTSLVEQVPANTIAAASS